MDAIVQWRQQSEWPGCYCALAAAVARCYCAVAAAVGATVQLQWMLLCSGGSSGCHCAVAAAIGAIVQWQLQWMLLSHHSVP